MDVVVEIRGVIGEPCIKIKQLRFNFWDASLH